MSEPAPPQPAQPAPAQPAPVQEPDPVPASQPVTIEPVDETPAQPASPAGMQASGTDVQPADTGPAEPGPGATGSNDVVPGAPAEVVDLGGAHIATQLRTGGATSNESPSLPQNIQSAGAKAHAGLNTLLAVAKDGEESAEDKLPQVIAIAEALQADLDRYVPESIRQAAMADVEKLLRKINL